MVEIVNSSRVEAFKRIDVLKEKYGRTYNVWFNPSSWGTPCYVEICFKKGYLFNKAVMDVFPNEINLYKKECLDFAKEVSDLFKIEKIELHYKEG